MPRGFRKDGTKLGYQKGYKQLFGFKKGYRQTAEAKKKIGEAVSKMNKLLGIIPPSNKGKKFSLEHRKRMSIKKIIRHIIMEEENKNNNMDKNIDKLEADKKEKFLKEFRKLVEKYGYDFDMSISVVKVNIQKPKKLNANK